MQYLHNDLEAGPPDLHGEGDDAPAGSYRIGGVSRLTGVPVTTLRVWETRHAAFTPSKSSGRHRLYTEVDVMRARMLRQLTAAGHSLGGIARLPLSELQRRLTGSRASAAPAARAAQMKPVSLVVVGEAVAARMNGPAWRQHYQGQAPRVQEVFADLQSAAQAAESAVAAEMGKPLEADILLVRLNAIQHTTAQQLTAAMARMRVNHTIVLYNFAAEPVLQAMRSDGMILRREPVSDSELVEVIRSVTVVDTAEAAPAFGSGATVPPRRYSDAELAKIAASPPPMLCECPRHIADLISQLTSFEDYSRQCLDTSPEDARIHAMLRSISGSARALFEHALQQVLVHAQPPFEGHALTPATGQVSAPPSV
ncbi:MAG: MerR family transcriptional regulator [Pseudomonadota bacterium]